MGVASEEARGTPGDRMVCELLATGPVLIAIVGARHDGGRGPSGGWGDLDGEVDVI